MADDHFENRYIAIMSVKHNPDLAREGRHEVWHSGTITKLLSPKCKIRHIGKYIFGYNSVRVSLGV